MLIFLEKPWVQVLLGCLLIGGLVFGYTTCSGPHGPNRKQETTITSVIASDQVQVGRDTAAARRAAASAGTAYEAGHAYAEVATILHQQSKAHATPTPASDSATQRLQRFLTNY